MKFHYPIIIITFLCFLLILITTLSPYDFHFQKEPNGLIRYFFDLRVGISSALDVINNILLFIPLGFSLSWCLIQIIKLEEPTSLIVTILICFITSYAIEALQIYLPSRSSSLIDVLSNSIGASLGFLFFLLWEYKITVIKFVSTYVGENFLPSFLGYIIFVLFISICFQLLISPVNWDRTYHLLLGNEQTGDRPWQGRLSELYFADRAISEEVIQAFSGKDKSAILGDSLLALYQLIGISSYHDKMGNLPELIWKGDSQNIQQGERVVLDHNHWLETKTPSVNLTERIIETSQFTLGITVAPSNILQSGPARIVSLSKDNSHRSFTLGQNGKDLIFRLRTPLTGKNGTNPQLVVPNVFSNTDLHNLVITYDGSVLLLYVDGTPSPHKLELAPKNISFNYLFQSKAFNLFCYKIFYYSILFVPLGILLLIKFNKFIALRRRT